MRRAGTYFLFFILMTLFADLCFVSVSWRFTVSSLRQSWQRNPFLGRRSVRNGHAVILGVAAHFLANCFLKNKNNLTWTSPAEARKGCNVETVGLHREKDLHQGAGMCWYPCEKKWGLQIHDSHLQCWEDKGTSSSLPSSPQWAPFIYLSIFVVSLSYYFLFYCFDGQSYFI